MKLSSSLLEDNAFIASLKEQYHNAKPFKHLKIDGFLNEEFANQLYVGFPKKEELTRHYKGLNEKKSEGANFELFNPVFSELRTLLNSPEFLGILKEITGVDGLFSTNDAFGSGVHQGENGSFLDVHIDFNIHHERKIHRRVNFLLYLNKDWEDEYGGALELWNDDVTKMEKAYLPLFNRCVIFEASDISYHGYSKIDVPAGVSRKSFYSYYYTPISEFTGKYHDTVFKARPEEGFRKKVKTDVKELMKNTAKRTLLYMGIKF